MTKKAVAEYEALSAEYTEANKDYLKLLLENDNDPKAPAVREARLDLLDLKEQLDEAYTKSIDFKDDGGDQ